MAFLDQADDWMAVGICQVGGGAFAAGGIWLFQFQSYNAGQYSAYFIYTGLGLGAGGTIGGASLPSLGDMLANGPDANNMQWSNLTCENLFSANDLNWAAGRVSLASLSAIVGYSLLLYICWKVSIDEPVLEPKLQRLGNRRGPGGNDYCRRLEVCTGCTLPGPVVSNVVVAS